MNTSDTIVALATPAGTGSRAVLRLSGPRALRALRSIAAGIEESPRGFRGRPVVLNAGSLRVPARVTIFRAPFSYTREDLVELEVPASVPLIEAVARAFAVQDGVRFAGPGEFTLRAYLSGRIDLSQAEAVEQLIAAGDRDEARAAQRGLNGELRDVSAGIRDRLIEAIALLEAALDFPDENLPEIAPQPVLEQLSAIDQEVRQLRKSTTLRLSARGSLHVALAGRPNAGKSSLLNALLGRREALVSSLEGTTRDPVRGETEISGTVVDWVDLAGAARDGGAPGLELQLPREGLEALRRITRVEMENADRILWVVDLTEDVAAGCAEWRGHGERSRLVVSKADLNPALRDAWLRESGGRAHFVSSLTREGVEELGSRLVQEWKASKASEASAMESAQVDGFLVSARQEVMLLTALEASRRAVEALESGRGYEFAAADLREALGALRELGGDTTTEDILGQIFSRFCIGK